MHQRQRALQVFDAANPNESCPARSVTTVTPQVFALFNSKFVHQQSQAMARRVAREAGHDPERQIEHAFELALQRAPTPQEKAKSLVFLRSGSVAEFCLVLLNLNEFISLE